MAAKRTSNKGTMIIDENILIGHTELNDTKAIDIKLVRTKANRYVAINNMYKPNSVSDWKTKKAIWLPFDTAKQIADTILDAHQKGLELEWDKPMERLPDTDINRAIDNVQAALDNLKEAMSANKNEVTQEQLSLFDKIANSLFKQPGGK